MCVILWKKKEIKEKGKIFWNQNKSEKVQVINYRLSPPCVHSKDSLGSRTLSLFGKKVIGQTDIWERKENGKLNFLTFWIVFWVIFIWVVLKGEDLNLFGLTWSHLLILIKVCWMWCLLSTENAGGNGGEEILFFVAFSTSKLH